MHSQNLPTPQFNSTQHSNIPGSNPQGIIQFNICGKSSHLASRCYRPGSGLAGQAPWRTNQGQHSNIPQFPTAQLIPFPNQQQQDNQPIRLTSESPAHLTSQLKDIIMVATITDSSTMMSDSHTVSPPLPVPMSTPTLG